MWSPVAGVNVGDVTHVYAVPLPDAATQFAGTLRLWDVPETIWELPLDARAFADAGTPAPFTFPTDVAVCVPVTSPDRLPVKDAALPVVF
jgi:hypothetical protein